MKFVMTNKCRDYPVRTTRMSGYSLNQDGSKHHRVSTLLTHRTMSAGVPGAPRISSQCIKWLRVTLHGSQPTWPWHELMIGPVFVCHIPAHLNAWSSKIHPSIKEFIATSMSHQKMKLVANIKYSDTVDIQSYLSGI